MIDGLQQRSLEQEPFVVELLFQGTGSQAAGFATGFGGTQVQQLTRIVPVVDGLGSVDTFVALQADEFAACPSADHLGDFGLADPGFAFQEQWTLQGQRQEHRRGQPIVGQVSVQAERLRHFSG